MQAAENVNGEVTIEIATSNGDINVETVNGDVVLDHGNAIDANFTFETVNGEMSATGQDVTLDTETPRRMEGTVGNGGFAISVETVNGDISLRP